MYFVESCSKGLFSKEMSVCLLKMFTPVYEGVEEPEQSSTGKNVAFLVS